MARDKDPMAYADCASRHRRRLEGTMQDRPARLQRYGKALRVALAVTLLAVAGLIVHRMLPFPVAGPIASVVALAGIATLCALLVLVGGWPSRIAGILGLIWAAFFAIALALDAVPGLRAAEMGTPFLAVPVFLSMLSSLLVMAAIITWSAVIAVQLGRRARESS
jgi:hypothetical protein